MCMIEVSAERHTDTEMVSHVDACRASVAAVVHVVDVVKSHHPMSTPMTCAMS